MSQRALLTVGLVAIVSTLAIGSAGVLVANRLPSGAATITIAQAQRSVQAFLDQTGNPDLKIDELMEFQDNFYALIKEHSTGMGAFELLVNKVNGAVGLEPGPNMMWNTKYSPMGRGMMGRAPFRAGATTAAMTFDSAHATAIAQAWLDRDLPGDRAGTPDAFYGYYTFHFERNGRIAGMLSVNGYTGQVWFHSWHGAFIRAEDFAL